MPGEVIPLFNPGESVILEVHKVVGLDELERMWVGVGEGLQQHHAGRAGRERKVFGRYRSSLRFELGLRPLGLHPGLLIHAEGY